MSDNRREARIKRIFRKFRLWDWDLKNGDVLSLAVRRQTINIGNGAPSARLQAVIDDLERQRALISETPKGETP
ncbi:MAG: hypothetical protein KBT76_15515 [Sulfitobacter litoralis]|nr:hypothetical protein [Sulfitobacter litoralis]